MAETPISEHKPYISADQNVAEFTVKSILLGVLFGVIFGAATVYLALKAGLTVSEIVDKMAINPRKILGLPVPSIGESQKANLVLFDVDTEWEYNLQNNFSKSSNSPFLGSIFKGKVWMCVNNGQVWKAE